MHVKKVPRCFSGALIWWNKVGPCYVHNCSEIGQYEHILDPEMSACTIFQENHRDGERRFFGFIEGGYT